MGIFGKKLKYDIVRSAQKYAANNGYAQYPNAIRKRGLYPVHLGKAWNKVGQNNIELRLRYKNLGEKNRRYKGLSDMYKLALNAGYFGKTIETTNWQYGPEVGYYCTIGNQFEILMLIEMLSLKGIQCVSANTDGIVCLFPKDLESEYYKICKEWEEIVGNTELGKLEYTDFQSLNQESVNHYIAIKSDGKLKIKGRLAWEVEMNKNNTDKLGRIERKAIAAYFEKGISPETTIKESTNIFDFVRGKKASRDYHYELINTETNNKEIYKTVIRYYVTENNKKLFKVKNENSLKTGPDISECEAPDDDKIWYCEIINRVDITKDIKSYNIDYEFYIRNTERVISKIDRSYRKKTNQISIFG